MQSPGGGRARRVCAPRALSPNLGVSGVAAHPLGACSVPGVLLSPVLFSN